MVIAAAGDSTRFGRPKPFVEIGGRCLIEYSLDALLASEYVGEVVICAREQDMAKLREIVSHTANPLNKEIKLCPGGKTRDESVYNAFRILNKDTRLVAFHDAARALITTEDADRIIETAFAHGAATASAKVVDSVKRADNKGLIKEDVDRSDLYTVSTPQVFLKEVYEVSRAVCKRDNFEATDDNAYVSHAGFHIWLCNVPFNPKLTYPEDLPIFELHLTAKRGGLQ